MPNQFPDGVVEQMIDQHYRIVTRLSESRASWQLSANQFFPEPAPLDSYRPDAPRPQATRLQSHSSAGARPAVIAGDPSQLEVHSYDDLQTSSMAVARAIVAALKASPAELIVAIVMRKSWRQVVSAVAALHCGAAYLPIDSKWPVSRQKHIIEASGAAAVIVDGSASEIVEWARAHESIACVSVDASLGAAPEAPSPPRSVQQPLVEQDLAYLIYTSGSTGLPKGVRCHHAGALNTIDDLVTRYSIGEGDRVLALSSLSFDLSVFDIFGMLQCGGAVVVPPADSVSPPDPEVWLRLLVEAGVTVWNTVPRFMELLVSHLEQTGERLPASVRVVFMSGDFIPLSLPHRIRAVSGNAALQIVSMGGATEAAIWSNIFELPLDGKIDPSWSSIPYGRPMRNQRMYVLDAQMRHCEPWVTGVIYIGGVGVAQGYHRDEEKTKFQFVRHPRTGEYLFRTGDLGRIRPYNDGDEPSMLIEILGREDTQVKIGGFRVELGEIERVLESHGSVDTALVIVVEDASALAAFITCKGEDRRGIEAALRKVAKDSLPTSVDRLLALSDAS
jgi:amino acid adenylation domain-containing protein